MAEAISLASAAAAGQDTRGAQVIVGEFTNAGLMPVSQAQLAAAASAEGERDGGVGGGGGGGGKGAGAAPVAFAIAPGTNTEAPWAKTKGRR